ncbi:MAG: LCP family protein [Clostridia bacterium]|nr:LCP family protein [Clostridia bacterium]
MKVFKTILKVLLIIFIIMITITAGVVGAVVYRNWARSQNEIIDSEGNITVKEDVELRENVTCLFMGVNGALTDFIMLGQYNPNTREVDLISIPRDTKVTGTIDGKINSAYASGYKPANTVQKVKEITGIEAQYYVLFDTKVLRQAVDAVGGVEVDVPINMNYDDPAQDLYIHLKKGRQTLTGKQAEQFVRFRKNNDGSGYKNGDIDRVATQQQFIKAMISRVLEPQNLLKLDKLFDIVISNTKTNVTLDILLSYTDDIITFKTDRIRIETLPGAGGYAENGISYFFMDKVAAEALIQEMFFKQVKVEEVIANVKEDSSIKLNTSDKIKIELLNAGAKTALFNQVVENLNNNGYYVSKIGNYESSEKERSRIICHDQDISKLEDLQKLVGISKTENDINADATVNYTIIIGPMYEL